MAVPVVVPARIVEDGVKTDPVDRNAGHSRRDDLMTDNAKPRWTQVALDPGLGDKQRTPVALVDGAQEVGEGTVLRVVDRNR